MGAAVFSRIHCWNNPALSQQFLWHYSAKALSSWENHWSRNLLATAKNPKKTQITSFPSHAISLHPVPTFCTPYDWIENCPGASMTIWMRKQVLSAVPHSAQPIPRVLRAGVEKCPSGSFSAPRQVLKLESQGPITHHTSTLEAAALLATPWSPSSPEHSKLSREGNTAGKSVALGLEQWIWVRRHEFANYYFLVASLNSCLMMYDL